ncbi:MAG: ankyrin repeat domain-containing protein [Chloroflexota bacterium]|nr:ankyrin repeat domain-containing protein [Chloroflexota bacterium]
MPDDTFDLVQAGDVAAVETLIAKDPGAVCARNAQELSPIQMAFFGGQHAVVDVLLAAGPKLDAFEAAIVGDAGQLAARMDEDPGLLTAYSPDGWTLLHLAPWAGQQETTQLLLTRCADLTAVSTNPLRNQALNAAVAGPNRETRTTCVRLLLEAGADANNRQVRGNTPLHTSAHLGDIESVEALLAHGADTGLRSDDGKSAADYAREGGHEELAKRLEAG